MIQISRASQRQMVMQEKRFAYTLTLGGCRKNNGDRELHPLLRIDHLILHGGYREKMHYHKNAEILLYIRKGVMLHKDTRGIQVPLYKTHLMMINAGNGLLHEESVPEYEESVEILQIFIRPQTSDIKPNVQFHALGKVYSFNEWRLIGGNENSQAPLKINSDVLFYDVRIQNNILTTPFAEKYIGLLYVVDGTVTLPADNIKLEKGDSVIVKNEALLVMSQTHADVVFFMLSEKFYVEIPYMFINNV